MTYSHPGLAVQAVVDLVGSQAALARALQVSAPTVNQWIKRRRPVPKALSPRIEALSCGVVSRRDLRPNDWQDIWPELAQPTAQEQGHA
ncbi:helix-turn-helix domain-containing protein [Delftia lacustris]|nr:MULTISPECIES: YdaS family helix-turn-helix protein [Delftia]QRI92423.1 helix-turn-helix domain-containing protein [Delftia lacustris]QRI92500.1 helix-turn-helix domain-containing protein [Delftia lacustris]